MTKVWTGSLDLDLSAEQFMQPIFAAGGSPVVAASFGVKPGKPILFDTSTREGVADLYEAAGRAAEAGMSSFLNLTSWAEVGPTLKGSTSTPNDELHILWVDIDRCKGGVAREVNRKLIKKLTARGCAVIKSPGAGRHIWFFMRDPMDSDEFQRLNTKLKHATGADDKDNIVNFLRLPYAPSYTAKHVRADGTGREASVVDFSGEPWDNQAFEKLLDSEGFSVPERASRVHRTDATPIVAEGYVRRSLKRCVRTAFTKDSGDVSSDLWQMWKECAKNDVTKGVALSLTYDHPTGSARYSDASLFDQIHKAYAAAADESTDTSIGIDVETFWESRPIYAHIRDTARALMASPWGTFGVVLMRTAAVIPTDVVLPATVGGEASLNGAIALCGVSGMGKGACEGAAEIAVDFGWEPHTENIGSGEGFPKTYAYRSGRGGEYVCVRDSAIISVQEIDTLKAIAERGGSTVMSEMRKVITGERLGMGNADPAKRIPVEKHRYRAALTIGVQPENAGPLINDAKGGTPQRLLWLPASDPHAPDEEPALPESFKWSMPGFNRDAMTGDRLAGLMLDQKRLREDLSPLRIPDDAAQLIKETRRKQMREEALPDDLDGHALLTRLKVSAWLMWLDGRRDVVTLEDWEHAGVVMSMSDSTRAGVRDVLRQTQWENEVRGQKRIAKLGVIGEDTAHAAKIAGVKKSLLKQLADNESMSGAEMRKRLRYNNREFFEDAMTELVDAGEIREVRAKQDGKRYRLAE